MVDAGRHDLRHDDDMGHVVGSRIAHDMDGFAPRAHILDRGKQRPPCGHEADVGRAEMLARPVVNGTGSLGREGVMGREIIAHAGKIRGLHEAPVLEIAIALGAHVAVVDDLGREFLFIAFARHGTDAVEHDVVAPMVLVIDRHVPMARIALADPALIADDRGLVRHDEVGDANIAPALAGTADRVVSDAEIGALRKPSFGRPSSR